jgi:hypothetical protein
MPKSPHHSSAVQLCSDELGALHRAEREDAVAEAIEAARIAHLPIDGRCLALLQRYIEGEISDTQLVAEIKRPYLN